VRYGARQTDVIGILLWGFRNGDISAFQHEQHISLPLLPIIESFFKTSTANMDAKETYRQVSDHYGSVSKSATGKYEHTVAKAFGYTDEELKDIPESANLGLSCGNPTALAKLREVGCFSL